MAVYFSEDFLRDVLDKNDIESIISRYVNLKRTGSSLKGLCPFHKEKTPSFSVSPEKQLYHCFGCGKSGTVINFVMDIENLDFIEAVKYLADISGLDIPENNVKNTGQAEIKNNIYKINKIAGRFFYNCLNSTIGHPTVEYIVKRGLTNSTVTKFGLGYAPRGKEIINLLKEQGFTEDQIVESGIVGKDERGNIYPRFANRLIFPIIDVRKNIIGFGGRVLDDSKPKYLNSPDTVVFNKSYNLYGLNIAKDSKTSYFILVEGYMDVISLHQNGITSAIATLGTALTKEQARIIKRMKNEVLICYDSDEAGQKATKRAIEILVDEEINVKVVTMPGFKDPDEYIKSRGVGAFNELVANAQLQIDYKMTKLKEQYNLHDTEDKIKYVNLVAKELVKLKSPVEREIYIKKISDDTGVSATSINSEIERILAIIKNRSQFDNFKATPSVRAKDSGGEYGKYIEAQKLILNIICYKDDIRKQLVNDLQQEDFSKDIYKQLFNALKADALNDKITDPRMLVLKYENNEVAEILQDDKNIDDYVLASNQCKSIIKQYVKKQKMLNSLKNGNNINEIAVIYKGDNNE